MKNTKKTLSIILSTLICLSICACGNSANTATSAETSQTEAAVSETTVTTTAEISETSESTTESNSETENDGKPGDPPDGQVASRLLQEE